MFDAMTALGLPGYSATVFLTNLFEIPRQLDAWLDVPKVVFDSLEEVEAAGERVD